MYVFRLVEGVHTVGSVAADGTFTPESTQPTRRAAARRMRELGAALPNPSIPAPAPDHAAEADRLRKILAEIRTYLTFASGASKHPLFEKVWPLVVGFDVD